MGKYHVISIPIAIMVFILTTWTFIQYMIDSEAEMESYYLNIATNYSVDAAVEEMLIDSINIDIDYVDIANAKVDPNIALQEFCRMMCENLGYLANEENMAMIRNEYLDGFIVVGYDGYYEAVPTKVSVDADHGSSYDWIFKPKKPFSISRGSNVYVLNMGGKTASTLTPQGIKTISTTSIASTIADYNSKTGTNTVNSIINSQVADAFTKSVYLNTGILNKAYHFPSSMSRLANANSIKGITALVQVSGVHLPLNKTAAAFSVGGARINQQTFTAAYIRGGKKYYIEAYRLTPTIKSHFTFGSNFKVYLNNEEAAKAGYQYDIEIREFK